MCLAESLQTSFSLWSLMSKVAFRFCLNSQIMDKTGPRLSGGETMVELHKVLHRFHGTTLPNYESPKSLTDALLHFSQIIKL